jgi:hypothetical protein
MVLSLRRRHRRVFSILAVFLPAAFVLGLVARVHPPTYAGVPPGLTVPQTKGRVVWTKAELFPGRRIITTLLVDGKGRQMVEFTFRELTVPDLLGYWVPGGGVRETARLPENARFLGAVLSGGLLPLPADTAAGGRIVLYSLAEHEVVTVSEPWPGPGASSEVKFSVP